MEEPDKPKEPNQIKTFAFLDLESTGLLDSSPRITELSVIAVSRAHLLEMTETAVPCSPPKAANVSPCSQQTSDGLSPPRVTPKLPRVLHKYTRLFYPWKVISKFAEDSSGLSNEALEGLPSFSKDSAEALRLFLDLPKPVALVAHNGKRFDFPLLMAELNRVGCADKFLELQCVDTLIAIKDIDILIEKEDIEEMTKLADSFTLDDFEDEIPVDAVSLSKRPRIKESEEEEEGGSSISNTPPSPYESASASPTRGNGHHHPMQVSAEPLMTPIKSRLPGQSTIPATPSKPSHSPPLPHTPESGQKGTPGTSGVQAKESSKVRKMLAFEETGKKRRRKQPLYKQPIIYRRLFDSEYEAHRAEEDAQALLRICGHYGSKFVEWADTFATSFASMKPAWVKRKSFDASQ